MFIYAARRRTCRELADLIPRNTSAIRSGLVVRRRLAKFEGVRVSFLGGVEGSEGFGCDCDTWGVEV